MSMTNMERLVEIMALLRDPERGCPWDVEQTFETIVPYTIEEAYEVADAVQRNDMAALVDELGDLLLQVIFHAQMAKESGYFDVEDVAGAICEKMVRRHPHVFGDTRIEDARSQTEAWEAQKARERQREWGDRTSALDGIPIGLPAIARALKLQKRAARVGFDWDDASQVVPKVEEELAELGRAMTAGAGYDPAAVEEELGDLLFTCINLARLLELDPDSSLRRANAKFEARFRRMEALLGDDGKTASEASASEREAAWERAKSNETLKEFR